MRLLFLIKEGLAGFTRARLASTLTVITVTLSLFLLGIFGVIVKNLSETYHRVYKRIQLEVFIDPTLSAEGLQRLQDKVLATPGVADLTYISPEQALAEFQKELGQDLQPVLEKNPLPPRLQVLLQTGYTRLEQVEQIARHIEQFPEVDDVIYQKQVIRLLNRYFVVGMTIAAIVGGLVFFISTVLIFNTIRLTIHSRRTAIEIMRLVGATGAFIKTPFIIEGLVQGLLGSLLAGGLIWLLTDAVRQYLFPSLVLPISYLAFLLVVGSMLGLLGSYISVGRYLKF